MPKQADEDSVAEEFEWGWKESWVELFGTGQKYLLVDPSICRQEHFDEYNETTEIWGKDSVQKRNWKHVQWRWTSFEMIDYIKQIQILFNWFFTIKKYES